MAIPSPTLRRGDSYDQAPMEVLCGVFADSVDVSHGRQPLRLTLVLPAFGWSDIQISELGRVDSTAVFGQDLSRLME